MGEVTVKFDPEDLRDIKAHIDRRVAEVAAKAQGADPHKVIAGAGAAIKTAAAEHDLGEVQTAALVAAIGGYLSGALGLRDPDEG